MADARDLVQDTMMRFLATFRDGQPPPEPRCARWLMKTLTRLLISDWRKQAVRKRAMADPALRLVPPLPAAQEPDPPATSMNAVMERMTGEDFKAAVNSLSPKLRATYELHVLGFSHAEIATHLGLSDSALRKRLHDARKHLRARLQLGLGEDEDP